MRPVCSSSGFPAQCCSLLIGYSQGIWSVAHRQVESQRWRRWDVQVGDQRPTGRGLLFWDVNGQPHSAICSHSHFGLQSCWSVCKESTVISILLLKYACWSEICGRFDVKEVPVLPEVKNVSAYILYNTLKRSTKVMNRSCFCSWHFSYSWHPVKIISTVPLLFLKPHWDSPWCAQLIFARTLLATARSDTPLLLPQMDLSPSF